jgi:hypothetical protein
MAETHVRVLRSRDYTSISLSLGQWRFLRQFYEAVLRPATLNGSGIDRFQPSGPIIASPSDVGGLYKKDWLSCRCDRHARTELVINLVEVWRASRLPPRFPPQWTARRTADVINQHSTIIAHSGSWDGDRKVTSHPPTVYRGLNKQRLAGGLKPLKS